MALDLAALSSDVTDFLAARHLATLTTLRADGRAHVAPVGFTYDQTTRLARVICSATSRKAINVEADPRVALCQLDGARWLTLEGSARVATDAENVAEGESRYTIRYQAPRPNPNRVVIVIEVERMMGRG
jgi:F420H(2)-dependent biliverdin reductase